jgi:hypothetical protein
MMRALLLASGLVSAASTPGLRGSRGLSSYSVPDFVVDYSECSSDPQTSSGSVTFYDSGAIMSTGGRVVSSESYKDISRITFDLNMTGMPASKQYGAFKIPAIYLISSATQPIGTNYCDQGGNQCSNDCLEIDIFEGNGGLTGQTTLHNGVSGGSDVCGDQQSWNIWASEPAWTDVLNNGCSGTAPSGTGVTTLSSWSPSSDVASIDVGITSTGMTVTLTSGGLSTVVFNSSSTAATGSDDDLDFTPLATANSDTGYWILASWWNSGSWQPGSSSSSGSLTYSSSGCSGCDWLCGCGSGWGISNMKVYTGQSLV